MPCGFGTVDLASLLGRGVEGFKGVGGVQKAAN